MWLGLVDRTRRWLHELGARWWRSRFEADQRQGASQPVALARLERVVLSDGVGRTLFEGFAAHRDSSRGHEETGWVLLGLREEREAIVLATLPAGAARQAGVAHVKFNEDAQALASRIVRQVDRRLTILGVVHTHPGSLRHPSDGDYRGDAVWVGQLRGQEGVFGIGTADGRGGERPLFARQPRPNVQSFGKLTFSWYALKQGDAHYRPLPVVLTLGDDLARPLHPVWEIIEAHADRLDRLARQQAGVTFDVVTEADGRALVVSMPLAEPGHSLRVLVREREVRYYLVRGPDLVAVDPHESRVDQGVYLVLADLAAQD